jgi:hypothetical protein
MKLASLFVSSLTILAPLGSVACGSSVEDGKTTSTAQGNSNPCGIHTSFAGDELCIPAPAENVGMQMHVGPPSYDNPDSEWIMQPGEEKTQCYHMYSPNTEDIFYFKQQYRMRTGSHHMIIMTSSDTTSPEGWGPCKAALTSAIGGTQRIVEDYPPGGKVAPEDEGLAKQVAAHTPFDVQLHFYNSSTKPTLREVWVNLLYVDKASVKTNLGMLGGFAPVQVPPHTSATAGGVCNSADAFPANDIRVVSLFGHAHTHNKRFAVYHQFADGTPDELVYDSYEGAEAPQYVYSTAVENPAMDPEGKQTGATSGDLVLHAGEALKFQCDIVNDLNITLTGQNEVFTAEMCNLFGSVAGLGFPCFKLN